jgi:hypothetical protein
MFAGGALRAIYTTVFLMNDLLVDQIKLLLLPENLTPANHTSLLPLKLSPASVSFPNFTVQVDQFLANIQGRDKESNISKLLRHWALILLNTLLRLVDQNAAGALVAGAETFL